MGYYKNKMIEYLEELEVLIEEYHEEKDYLSKEELKERIQELKDLLYK